MSRNRPGYRPSSLTAAKLSDKTDVLLPEKPGLQPSGLEVRSEIDTAVIVSRGFRPAVLRKPHIGVLLADAYSVIAEEIRKLREKSEAGEALSETDARKLAIYTSQFAKLAAEEREQLKQDKVDEMSDQELVAAAKEALDKFQK